MQNILAIFLPFIIGALNTKFKSSRVRFWIAIVVSIIVGVALNVNQMPSFTFSDPAAFLNSLATLIVYVGLVVGTAQATYLKYWQKHPAFVTLFGQPNSATPVMPIAGTTQAPTTDSQQSAPIVPETSSNDTQQTQQ